MISSLPFALLTDFQSQGVWEVWVESVIALIVYLVLIMKTILIEDMTVIAPAKEVISHQRNVSRCTLAVCHSEVGRHVNVTMKLLYTLGLPS